MKDPAFRVYVWLFYAMICDDMQQVSILSDIIVKRWLLAVARDSILIASTYDRK